MRNMLPGVTTLARLVARERDAATLRTWTELAQSASGGQARRLRRLLVVPDGARRSELDRLRNDADVARLSPYMRRHINFHGHYSFAPTNLGGARRALRDPDAPDDDG